VSYIDAGYAIALAVLAGYAGQLWQRRRRLERLAARTQPETATATAATAPVDRRVTPTLSETRVGA